MSAWLTVAEAAKRIGKAPGTIYKWNRWGALPIIAGRVNEETLVEVDSQMREKIGRPRNATEKGKKGNSI